MSWDKLLCVIFLLGCSLWEGSQASNNASNHENQADDRPDDTPALARAAVSLGEYARIGLVDFS